MLEAMKINHTPQLEEEAQKCRIEYLGACSVAWSDLSPSRKEYWMAFTVIRQGVKDAKEKNE